MADKPLTKNVFLDTEVFKRCAHAFEEGNLLRVAELGQHDVVKIYLTAVIEGEVRRHLDEDVKEVVTSLNKVKKQSKSLRKFIPLEIFDQVDEAKLREETQRKFGDYITKSKLEILPLDPVSVDEVFDLYFKVKPPFGGKGKSKEFPDAFTFLALKSWCEYEGVKMYVVTHDLDFQKACEGEPSFIYVDSVDKVLELFQEPLAVARIKVAFEGQESIIKNMLIEAARYLEYTPSDENLIDPEIDDFDIEDVKIEEYHVVHVETGKGEITAECEFEIRFSVTGHDPGSGFRDPDNGEWYATRMVHAESTRNFIRTVTITATIDPENPELITFSNVEFLKGDVELRIDASRIREDEAYYEEYFGEYNPDEG